MSGFDLGTAMDAVFMMAGGYGFAHLGWSALKRPAPAPEPAAAEPAPPPPRTSLPWKLFWILLLLFGAFVLVCGIFLALSTILPE